MTDSSSYIRRFDELGIHDVPLVGGKNASLGEMARELLGPKGINLADGIATTAEAYRHFLASTGLDKRIRKMPDGLDTHSIRNLQQRGRSIRQAIMATRRRPVG